MWRWKGGEVTDGKLSIPLRDADEIRRLVNKTLECTPPDVEEMKSIRACMEARLEG